MCLGSGATDIVGPENNETEEYEIHALDSQAKSKIPIIIIRIIVVLILMVCIALYVWREQYVEFSSNIEVDRNVYAEIDAIIPYFSINATITRKQGGGTIIVPDLMQQPQALMCAAQTAEGEIIWLRISYGDYIKYFDNTAIFRKGDSLNDFGKYVFEGKEVVYLDKPCIIKGRVKKSADYIDDIDIYQEVASTCVSVERIKTNE